MAHFSADHWIDFARNLLPEPRTASMQGHLVEGCHECRKAFEIWRLVVDLSSNERLYRPPESVVRIAKAAFVPNETSGSWLRQVAQFASLAFDSFRQPAAAGVRSALEVSRQLVHHAPPYTIDLKLETDTVRKEVHLVGQILDSQNPERSIDTIDVVLLRGVDVIGKVPTNRSGEFQMQFKDDADLQLFINIRGERAIGVDLPVWDA